MIKDIDQKVTKILSDIEAYASLYTFKNVFEFNLHRNVQLPEISNKPGIYLFEIYISENKSFVDWLNKFQPLWEHSDYQKSFTPNFKKKRIKENTNKNDWIPLYIGQSKKLSERIRQHLYLDIKKPTNALKLLSRTNIYGIKLRISIIEIDVKNNKIILPIIEHHLRERYNPVLGRQ